MTNHERKLKEQRKFERAADKLKREGSETAINILQILPTYILAFKCGYGNVRLERFLLQMHRYVEQISKDAHILELMMQELEHSKGMRFDLTTGDVDNLWRDDDDTRKVINKPRKAAKS